MVMNKHNKILLWSIPFVVITIMCGLGSQLTFNTINEDVRIKDNDGNPLCHEDGSPAFETVETKSPGRYTWAVGICKMASMAIWMFCFIWHVQEERKEFKRMIDDTKRG